MENFDNSVNSAAEKRIISVWSNMKKLRLATLAGMRDQLACHPWREDELEELVDPKLGVITGFQELLDELEILRNIDLDAIPPAPDKPAK